MILDLQILPRGAGKSVRAKRAASTSPNALYIYHGISRPAPHPTFTSVSDSQFLYYPIAYSNYPTIIIDELFSMPLELQQFIVDNHHHMDFYIYTGRYSPNDFCQPFLNLLESDHPEFLI